MRFLGECVETSGSIPASHSPFLPSKGREWNLAFLRRSDSVPDFWEKPLAKLYLSSEGQVRVEAGRSLLPMYNSSPWVWSGPGDWTSVKRIQR